MKDIKLDNPHPVLPGRAAGNRAKPEAAQESFSDTLSSTVANLHDLHRQLPAGTAPASAAASGQLQQEIDNARQSFDRMMAEKQNLFQLYQRIINKEDG